MWVTGYVFIRTFVDNTTLKQTIHLRRVHSGHYSDNICQKLPGDEFPAEIWYITGAGFNWVRAHSQNFVLILEMRISFKKFVYQY